MAIKEIEKDGKKLLEYRFQPKLEDGTPIGGEQVVYGETNDELMDAAANSYTHLYRNNRELNIKAKVNPEGAAPVVVTPRFQPRPLDARERMELARDFTNPEKIDEAADRLLEAKFGAKPATMSQSVENNAIDAEAIRAGQEATAWREQHPEVYMSQKNVSDIANWVRNRNMKYTVENLDKALADLSPALEIDPASSPGTPDKAPVDTLPAALPGSGVGEQPLTPKVPSSVKRNTGSNRGSVKKEGTTIKEFQRLTQDARRKFMQDNPNYVFPS